MVNGLHLIPPFRFRIADQWLEGNYKDNQTRQGNTTMRGKFHNNSHPQPGKWRQWQRNSRAGAYQNQSSQFIKDGVTQQIPSWLDFNEPNACIIVPHIVWSWAAQAHLVHKDSHTYEAKQCQSKPGAVSTCHAVVVLFSPALALKPVTAVHMVNILNC